MWIQCCSCLAVPAASSARQQKLEWALCYLYLLLPGMTAQEINEKKRMFIKKKCQINSSLFFVMNYDFIVSEIFSLNPQETVNITVTNREATGYGSGLYASMT